MLSTGFFNPWALLHSNSCRRTNTKTFDYYEIKQKTIRTEQKCLRTTEFKRTTKTIKYESTLKD